MTVPSIDRPLRRPGPTIVHLVPLLAGLALGPPACGPRTPPTVTTTPPAVTAAPPIASSAEFGIGAYRAVDVTEQPTLVSRVAARYTPQAMRAAIQGEVRLDIVVAADGTVGDVRIAKSLDQQFGLDDEAIKTIKQWVFKPGTLDGKAVPVILQAIIVFRLHERPGAMVW
jgi:TonB family protein